MNSINALSAKVLGQIALMQSVITQLPDIKSMLTFTCRGFKDISGVEDVNYRLYENGSPDNKGHFAQCTELRLFTIKHKDNKHADLLFRITDDDAFSPYVPYVNNYCGMLAVIIEERNQRYLNESLMEDLEKRVQARTMELQLEIQERKLVEETLAFEKERLSIIIGSIGDGVITTDVEGRVLIVNKVAENLTGWTQEEARGRPLNEVFKIIDEITRETSENPVEKVLKTGTIVELANHTMLISRDNREMVISDTGAPIKDASRKTIGVVLVFRDITEKQKLLETTQRASKLESLGVLAGGIAHDFNNLLGGIFGYIDLANEKAKETAVNECLVKAMSSINRARGLTQQLLTFAKGGVPIKAICNLSPFICEAAQFALSGSNVLCNYDIQKDLWCCEIDKNQIGQVLDNLLINAQQAMTVGGTIQLTVKNVRLDESSHNQLRAGPYVKISIKDSGAGISKKILPRIFDPFFTTRIKGHGLGLATCYSIIQRHGGCIDVESEIDYGTTFHFFLPASPDDVGLLHEIKSPQQHKGCGTIIVVDDEEIIRVTFGSILKSLGYNVVCKADGRDAIEFYSEELIANRKVVGMIFDLTIPGGMGGKEAVVKIREIDKEIPVFVSSGYADDPVIANPEEYGFTASICKPFVRAELANILNMHLK